jgi:heptosyltransferase-2
LIIRGGSIGDFVLTLPALHAFRDRFPEVKLELLGYPHIAELAHQRFYFDTLRSLDHRNMAMFFASSGPLDPELSRRFASFDLVVSYLYDPDALFRRNLRRAGSKRVIVADGRPASGSLHASRHLAQWLMELQISTEVGSPRLYPSELDRAEAHERFPTLGQRTVALHLGSGSPSKNWALSRYVELAQWLRGRGLQVLVVTGLADTRVDAVFWKDPVSDGCLRCNNLKLPVLAAVLQQCAAFVGNDSGISHIAAAVGVPTVAIFGVTDPRIWEPRGKTVRILRREADLDQVTLDDVTQALEELLAGHRD